MKYLDNCPYQFRVTTKKKIAFLSNHKDITFLKSIGYDVELIIHPYIEPEWSEEQVQQNCAAVINRAVDVDLLVMNGDYFFVAIILKARLAKGKRTGFIAIKKFNEPCPIEKDVEGKIMYKNIVKP